MADNEIIKALEKEIHLAEYVDSDYCSSVDVPLLRAAIDLINCYKAEIERLKKECEAHRNTVIENEQRFLALNLELESEIDKQYEQAKADILGNISDGGTSCHWCIAQHESEARKEFAERLKKEINVRATFSREQDKNILRYIDNLLKRNGE